MRRRLLSVLVLTGLLAACTQLPEAKSGVAVAAHSARTGIGSYFLTGRIAVSREQQRQAANISWQHSAARDEIFLTTPLGQGVAELIRDAAGARLTTAERGEFSAPDWQALSVQVFGFPLPLSALPLWLLADVPAGALGIEYDSTGRPQRMMVDGWQVAYLEYDGDDFDALPTLIEMKHEGIETVEVRLKIDEWRLSR